MFAGTPTWARGLLEREKAIYLKHPRSEKKEKKASGCKVWESLSQAGTLPYLDTKGNHK